MVLGVLSLVLVFIPGLGILLAVLAVIFAGVALAKSGGKGMAIAGVSTGSLGFIIGVIGIAAAGSAHVSSPTKSSAAPTPSSVSTASVAPVSPASSAVPVAPVAPAPSSVSAASVAPAAPPSPAAPAGPLTEFGPGTYEVGIDIKTGTHKTSGPDKSDIYPSCYWARNKDASGSFESIIANDNIGGPGTVTLKKGEVFEASGSCTWKFAR
jgi:hypothetical protein